MKHFFEKHRTILLAVVFTIAVMATAPGISNQTSPTSKDEYHRIFRTALTMMEENVWLVPVLDGNPRIEKPPLLNWLTRLSFELFGVSLLSARLIVVLFTGLLIAVVAATGWELTDNIRYGVAAAAIALSNIGIAIHGRILLPDIPTAALSSLAFYFFLKWAKTGLAKFLPMAAVVLAASFLAKGPVAFVVFGSGVLALSVTSESTRAVMRLKMPQIILALALFVALSLLWYAHVYLHFSEYTMKMLQVEYKARRFGSFHLDPILQFAVLFFPWTLLLIGLTWRYRRGGFPAGDRQILMLLLWILLSLAPFFFIRSFDRYLLGTLVPAALFCAKGIGAIKPLRAGTCSAVLLSVLSVGLIIASSFWFKISSYEVIALSLLIIGFAWIWWRAQQFWAMAAISALLWCALVGFVFPTFGVNAIPAAVIDQVEGRRVFLFRDPQPAILPIAAGHSADYVLELSGLGRHCQEKPLVFSLEEYTDQLEVEARAMDIQLNEIYRYKTILAMEKLAKTAFKDFSGSELRSALKGRSLEPLKTDILMYESLCEVS